MDSVDCKGTEGMEWNMMFVSLLGLRVNNCTFKIYFQKSEYIKYPLKMRIHFLRCHSSSQVVVTMFILLIQESNTVVVIENQQQQQQLGVLFLFFILWD